MPRTDLADESPDAPRRRPAGDSGKVCHALRLHGRRFPAEQVARFLEDGLEKGARYFAVCSPAHWRSVRERLTAEHAPCLFLDSRGMARKVAAGRREALEGLLAEMEALVAASRGQSDAGLRIFTDVGSRLRRQGLDQEALEAEEALSQLCRRHGAAILCVYPVHEQDPLRRDYHQQIIRHDRVLTS